MNPDWLQPQWPAPARVQALCTSRNGGSSSGTYDSLNLGDHVGDAPAAVAANRATLAKALGVKLELTQITGANRLPFLLTDKVDIVISVMGLTPERAKQIMFSSPYANTSLAVYGPKNIVVKSAMDLGKYKVAAAKGTTQEMALSAANPKANIMRTEDDATAASAYLSGQAQLFSTNSIVAIDLAKKNPTKEFDLKFNIRNSPAHMGVKMGEHNLVRWLDSFVFFNTQNTELDKLHQKWLNRKMDAMPAL